MPITLGDKEYTEEQLTEALQKADAYKKLEPEFTKKSQSLSELEKQSADLKKFQEEWAPFASWINTNPEAAAKVQTVIEEFTSGNVTQKGINTITQQIGQADKRGDDELRKELEEIKSQMLETQMDKTFAELEARATKDDLDGFSIDGFKEFADKWLSDELGLGDDDDVTPKHLRQAYTAYEAHLLRETIKSGKLPRLGSQGGGTPTLKADKDAPKGLAARIRQAQEALARSK